MENPFRPGAGHMPLYLAGRDHEKEEFRRLLGQDTIFENLVLTGLRGIGKTVLLETFKPMAIDEGWLWVGTDLSESASISEETLAIRLLTDLSVVTSGFAIGSERAPKYFQQAPVKTERMMTHDVLLQIFNETPGLVADKLRRVLETAWEALSRTNKRGLIFAYDEAQNLADHAAKEQYPLSLLLDIFQSIQRRNVRFMLALTGLPTLVPKLVTARTYAERMFHVIFLAPLDRADIDAAVAEPIRQARCPFGFSEESMETIWEVTRGYPYFIQYVCREVFDVWVQSYSTGQGLAPLPINAIVRKLDSDFFAGRWARATDRQRELLAVIAHLQNPDGEFTVQDVVTLSGKMLDRPFNANQVNQLLVSLGDSGLVYRNRHGKYAFAVPLMAQFIRRRTEVQEA